LAISWLGKELTWTVLDYHIRIKVNDCRFDGKFAMFLKFMYAEKATKFWELSIVDLTVVTT
jgi:hypothetical protein